MFGRVLAAGLTVATIVAWGSVPALAQLKTVPAPASYRTAQPAYSNNFVLAASHGSYALFPSMAEFGPGASRYLSGGPGYAAQINYTVTPVFGAVSASRGEVVTLRDVSISAMVLPGVRLDVSRWSIAPGIESWDARAAGAEQNLVRAATALRTLYAPMGSNGFYAGVSIALTDSLSLQAGRALSSPMPVLADVGSLPRDFAARLGAPAHTIETTAAGIDWNFSEWTGVGLTASQTREASSVLGTPVLTKLGVTSVEPAALGISARVGFGSGWVTTIAYNEGVTQLDLRQSGVLGAIDPMRSQTYGLALAKHGLFGDDALGIAVSRPLNAYNGGNLAAALGKMPVAESDIQVGYVTTFLDGALALQANAAYQMNANGNERADAVSVLSRAKIRF